MTKESLKLYARRPNELFIYILNGQTKLVDGLDLVSGLPVENPCANPY